MSFTFATGAKGALHSVITAALSSLQYHRGLATLSLAAVCK
jgi:hypothetical protein